MLLYTSVVSLEEPETGLGGSEGPAHIIERYCGNGGSGHLGKLSVNRCVHQTTLTMKRTTQLHSHDLIDVLE